MSKKYQLHQLQQLQYVIITENQLLNFILPVVGCSWL